MRRQCRCDHILSHSSSNLSPRIFCSFTGIVREKVQVCEVCTPSGRPHQPTNSIPAVLTTMTSSNPSRSRSRPPLTDPSESITYTLQSAQAILESAQHTLLDNKYIASHVEQWDSMMADVNDVYIPPPSLRRILPHFHSIIALCVSSGMIQSILSVDIVFDYSVALMDDRKSKEEAFIYYFNILNSNFISLKTITGRRICRCQERPLPGVAIVKSARCQEWPLPRVAVAKSGRCQEWPLPRAIVAKERRTQSCKERPPRNKLALHLFYAFCLPLCVSTFSTISVFTNVRASPPQR